ncbi:MAG: MarR family winged helix-turn-helix transcriptional regulator [Alphaproteobacteria bacterium]|nr:MarR family winged helix-turn-helix transcriptional regulator [Alphaproteobacteria bacterium]
MSDVETSERSETVPGDAGDFDLESFFPYLVRVYYRSVSESVTSIYATLFGLSVSEWRAMAVLGTDQAMSASELVARSSMDKVNVSRAVQGLRKGGLLKRDIDGDDRRRSVLRLTEKGRETLRTLVPLVRKLEEELLEGLSSDERDTLIRLMEKVRKNADALRRTPH